MSVRSSTGVLGRGTPRVPPSTGGGSLEVLDEGVSLGTFTKMNFEGAGVIASVDGGDPNQTNITIPGAGAGGNAVVSSVLSCPAGVAVNDAVYLSGAGAVDQADSDDALKQPLIGIVSSKPTAVTCVVTYYGEVAGFAGLTAGATYYLGTTPGTITTTAPSTPGNIVQRMGFALSATVLVVMTDRDWTEIT